ncbi:MAG: cytochrome c biogenesis protein CcdA [Salaquimonas sp.]|jgi:cytochrome c-type biogenesis protein|nr:cytochrome c biogenesis protein CcdA [Salaquimonas sp.]
MTADITYLSAFLAGLISFITPCVLPLVPPYLCYMGGVSVDALTRGGDAAVVEAGGSANAARVFAPALAFVAGFSSVFIALGAGASTIGVVLRAHMDVLGIVAGVLIIAMGLNFLGVLRLGLFYREARFQGAGGAGIAGSFVMGLAFAFGWTPCIGPVLGVILAVAGSRETVGEGAALLAVYSAGLGVPFLIAAAFVGPFMQFLARFRRHLGTVEKLLGLLLVITGLLFLTGGMQRFSFWLLETFPALGQFG